MILVGVAAGAFILDKLVTALWWEPWKQVTEQIRKADEDLARAKSTLKREASAREGWKTIRSLLDQQRIPDVQTHFGEHLTEINVTSPTGLQEINRLDGVKLEARVWDAIEHRLGRRRAT